MEILLKNINKIVNNKLKLEKPLKVKISRKANKLEFLGEQVDEYIAQKVFQAIDAGFEIETALVLTDPEYLFETINIKDLTRRKNLALVKARIVGTKGQTINLIDELSNCHVVLHESTIYIIGHADDIKNATNGIIRLVQGSKQSSVYAYLEKQRKVYHPEDLGLKVKFK